MKNGFVLSLFASLLVFSLVSDLRAHTSVTSPREIPSQDPQDAGEKRTRNPAQQKVDSQLLMAARLKRPGSITTGPDMLQQDGAGRSLDQRSRKYDCLPKDARLDDVVTYDRTGKQNLTLQKTLINLKATCRKGKLVDAKRRAIRFFRFSCWGHPPPNYLEIERREDEELKKLKRQYTVIVFGCNPMIASVRFAIVISTTNNHHVSSRKKIRLLEIGPN